jgi:alpha-D-ribose 1-methylphosphonate 5-triphosphate synthase subunit PhnG
LGSSATADVSATDADRIHIVGVFSRREVEAIVAVVREVDDQPVLSIVQRPDAVEVETGVVCGELCGGGNRYTLRKVGATWSIVDRTMWIS